MLRVNKLLRVLEMDAAIKTGLGELEEMEVVLKIGSMGGID
jgi:hypothetical protein